MADESAAQGPGGAEDAPQSIDLTQVRVEGLMLAVASELSTIGAGHLGMVPEMVNGGDALQASLAINGADALVEALIATLPPEVEVPPQVTEMRGMIAQLKLAYVEAVRAGEAAEGDTGEASAGPAEGAAPPPPPMGGDPAIQRPKIWTPGGDV